MWSNFSAGNQNVGDLSAFLIGTRSSASGHKNIFGLFCIVENVWVQRLVDSTPVKIATF